MTAAEAAVHRVAVVVNKRGLHARAAALVARIAGQFEAEVTVATTAEQVSALSIMGMLMLGANTGTALQFNARGPDAEDAADALVRLVENGFEEDDFSES
jgi:phosphocarrier protein HPr